MEQRPSAMDPIRFTFDERKATAAAAVFLVEHGGRMPYMKLVKLLYMAERESLRRHGRPVFGDKYFSLPLGPVVSTVLDLIKREADPFDEHRNVWSAHVQRQGWDVALATQPDLGCLSDAELEMLREIASVFRALDQWQLSDLTHALPEFRDPSGSHLPISPEDILRALSKTDEEVEEVREDAIERKHFDSIFGA
ncbi:MAG: SocA family protein [Candidatus Eisenbacteria bacterium]|nr:SocA family protein [Candidatus Eisenbacteria bacterium]